MPQFHNVDDAIKYLVKHSNKIFQELSSEVIIPTIQESIDEVVYDAYTPRGYIRRKNDKGLRDAENFDTSSDISGNTIYITVQSLALPNTSQDESPIDMRRKQQNEMRYLDWLVVYGEGYTWKNSNIYKQMIQKGSVPRDFYTHATNTLRKTLPIALAKKFKQLGIEVEYELIIR